MEIRINKVVNGYLLESYKERDLDDYKQEQVVFEFQEEEEGDIAEMKTFRSMVYYLMDYFAVPDSKHNKKRITIDLLDN